MPGILVFAEQRDGKLKKPGRYADGGSLYLNVSNTGSKSWLFRYKRDGVGHWMGLGSVSTFSLKEAREKARSC